SIGAVFQLPNHSYEKRYPPDLPCRHYGDLRLRQQLYDRLDRTRAQSRIVQRLPPLLYRQPEAGRHRPARREVPKARCEEGRIGALPQGQERQAQGTRRKESGRDGQPVAILKPYSFWIVQTRFARLYWE